jgi:hypothetical protein
MRVALDSRTLHTLPLYEQVLDFLIESPSTQEIIAFRPSNAAQKRFSALLALNRERDLATTEEEEPEHYIQIDRMMPLLKAKAYSRLDFSAVPEL